jgi:glycosyltransferase involved in cell wall biosynthesis
VICLDLGGPALQVTDNVGVRVPAQQRHQAIQGIADAMAALAQDPERRKAMGEAGRARVASPEYSWDSKVAIYEGIYREVIDRSFVNT